MSSRRGSAAEDHLELVKAYERKRGKEGEGKRGRGEKVHLE